MSGKKAVLIAVTLAGAFLAQADEPKYGGIRFDCDVTVDGVAVAANTAIYAETWPTQFLVKPVLASGETIYSFTATTDPGDSYPKRVYPCLNGNFFFIPPSAAGTVTDFKRELATKVVWVDAEAKDGDTNGKGTYAEPWHTLQYAVDHCGHSTGARIIISAKPGTYDEGGMVYNGITNRVVLSEYMLLRAAEGPDVTFIEGKAGSDPTYAETLPGTGPDAIRCITFSSMWDSAVQGFTLKNGHTDGPGANWYVNKAKGGAMFGYDASSQLLDCVITNCTGGLGVTYEGSAIRCRFVGNKAACIVYGTRVYGCLFYGNVSGAGSGGNWLSTRVVNCTVAQDGNLQTGPFYNSVLWDGGWWPTSASVAYYCSVGSKGTSSSYIGYTGDSTGILADIAACDFRVISSSKANGGATLPEKGTDAWTAWEKALCWSVRGDINGNRNLFANGQPVAGAVQTLAYPVNVSEDYGTLAVKSGGKVGMNYLSPGDTLVITQADDPQRHANGIVIDGAVTNLFVDGEATYTVAEGHMALVEIEPLYLRSQNIVVPTDGKARLTVTGGIGTEGVNPVEVGYSITLAPNESGSRYAAGITVGGKTYYFDELPGGVWTYTVPEDFEEDTLTVTTIISKIWYVATNGSDSAKGISTNCPFASYTRAESMAVNGETVRFLPGVYGDAFGYMTSTFSSVESRSRIIIAKDVTVDSLAGPEKTFLVGSPAPSGDGWGRGAGAVRCCYCNGNSMTVLRGFTLTGGRTLDTNNQYSDPSLGGAVLNSRSRAVASAIVENCIVSNNACGWGVLYGVTARNCRIVENFATTAAAAHGSNLQGCLVERNVTYGDGPLRRNYDIGGCTIGSVNYKTNGIALGTLADTVANSTALNEHYGAFYNNLVLGTLSYINSTIPATNCVFKTGTASYYGNAGRHNEFCLFSKTDDEIALNADSTLGKDSVAIDAGWTALTNTVTDLNGGQRIYNGEVDAGAVEYDWRGDYARDLSKRGQFAVSNASPEVTETDAKTVLVPAGARVKGVWTSASLPKYASVRVRIVGAGTFTVTVGGVAVATLAGPVATATDVVFPTEAGKTVEFAYEGDDGCAEILKLGLPSGLLLLVR